MSEMKTEERLALKVATSGNPALAMAVLAAARGDSILTLHCPIDGSAIYVKPVRVMEVLNHPRGARITFTAGGDNSPVLVSEGARRVREMIREAIGQ